MGASITLAGESLIAQKQAAQQILDVQRFIFANVPGLDPAGPVDRAAGKPAADRIVYTAEIPNDNAGYVNPNQVVYSLQVGSDVGDWDFNWIGLESAEGVLFAVAYVPTQQKRRNVPPLQIGNNITRNFLVVYDGAQALTGITIDASTWQHDFTVRLAGIDERERQSNRDIFGRACFFGSALQVEKVGSAYQVKPGTAYIEGIRVQRSTALAIVPPALPTTAWLDVVLQRELSDVVASWSVVFGTDLVDRTDSAGARHYLVPIADLVSAASLLDRRPVEAIAGPLVQHFAARVGDYPQLRARATTKADVGLSELPNALSDDPETNSSLILATTKAVKAAASAIWGAIESIVSGATVVGKAAKLATARTISISGAVTGSASFDGSSDVNLVTSSTARRIARLSSATVQRLTGTETGPVAFAPLNFTFQADGGMYLVIGKIGLNNDTRGAGGSNYAAVKLMNGATVLDTSTMNIVQDLYYGQSLPLLFSGPLSGQVNLSVTFLKSSTVGMVAVNGDRDDTTSNDSGQLSTIEIYRMGA